MIVHTNSTIISQSLHNWQECKKKRKNGQSILTVRLNYASNPSKILYDKYILLIMQQLNYFANNIIILLERATNSVIASVDNGALAIFAKS